MVSSSVFVIIFPSLRGEKSISTSTRIPEADDVPCPAAFPGCTRSAKRPDSAELDDASKPTAEEVGESSSSSMPELLDSAKVYLGSLLLQPNCDRFTHSRASLGQLL